MMTTLHLRGIVTEDGRLEVTLPPGTPPGEARVDVTLEPAWTEAELAAMMQFHPVRTGAELIELLDQTGDWWAAQNITDPVEWLEAMRRKDAERSE
jgi:hypothetical protein